MDAEQAYRILGVAPGADPKEVQRAYRRQALAFHPDRAGTTGDKEYFTQRFLAVRDAYEQLRREGFPGPSTAEILDEVGLADPAQGLTPAGRSFYQARKKEDEEMPLAQKLGFSVRVDLEAIFLWGVLIPGGAVAVVLFVRHLWRMLGAGF